MAWYRIALSTTEQGVVNEERDSHPDVHIRRKMLVLWLLHCGVTRELAATIAGLGRATVQRYVAAYRDGGLDGLRQWDVTGPVSDLAAYSDAIRDSLTVVSEISEPQQASFSRIRGIPWGLPPTPIP
jgi:hypothetical protein